MPCTHPPTCTYRGGHQPHVSFCLPGARKHEQHADRIQGAGLRSPEVDLLFHLVHPGPRKGKDARSSRRVRPPLQQATHEGSPPKACHHDVTDSCLQTGCTIHLADAHHVRPLARARSTRSTWPRIGRRAPLTCSEGKRRHVERCPPSNLPSHNLPSHFSMLTPDHDRLYTLVLRRI